MTKEYIRYLTVDGDYKFPSVKDVGVIEELITVSKESLVEAINEVKAQVNGRDAESLTMAEIISNVQRELELQKSELALKLDSMLYNGFLEDTVEALTQLRDTASQYSEKFKSIDSQFEHTEEELMNKIGTVEFDNAVGVNKWKITKYKSVKKFDVPISVMDLYNVEKGEVYEVDDSEDIELPSGLCSYYTNVYVSKETIVELVLNGFENVNFYMNGASIYNAITNGNGALVSMSLNKGWNTLEIVSYKGGDDSTFKSSKLISLNVDKMSTVIGIGTANETKYTQLTTIIDQTNEAISLKAENETVQRIGTDIQSLQAEVNIQADAIKDTVSKKTYDLMTGKVEGIESTILQQAEMIESKVSNTVFDTLNTKVGNQETIISQLLDAIKLKVDTTTYNAMTGIVAGHTSELDLLAKEIKSKVSETSFNEQTGLYDAKFTLISQTANNISQTVASQDKRISNLSQNYDEIKGEIYNADGTSAIRQRFDSIESTVTETNNRLSGVGGVNLINGTGSYVGVKLPTGWYIADAEADRPSAKIIYNNG